MASAAGIAGIFGELSAKTYRFTASDGGVSNTGFVEISGTWDVTTTNGNTINWAGTDPSLTADQDRTANRLAISYLGNFIVIISHDDVTLSEGDTIIYTNIDITFETSSVSS